MCARAAVRAAMWARVTFGGTGPSSIMGRSAVREAPAGAVTEVRPSSAQAEREVGAEEVERLQPGLC